MQYPRRLEQSEQIGSLGAYLALLGPEQEGRLLTGKLASAPSYKNLDGSGCLVGIAEDIALRYNFFFEREVPFSRSPEIEERRVTHRRANRAPFVFEVAVARFGIERVSRAIRNRILRNQARRALAGVPMQEGKPMDDQSSVRFMSMFVRDNL